MNEPMASDRTCPKCGALMALDTTEGLCPACLLALNLATQTELPEDVGPNGTKKVPPPPKSPPTPQDIAGQFPQFEILECLGRGGMGVVYKARQKSLDRLVALKILAPEREKDPQFAERFAREAKTLAQLSHPNIVTVHDFGEASGMFYLVMEFVDGVNLRQLLRERKLSPEEALAIVPPVCEALQYAHTQGVIHRDIKPENLLLDKQGRIKIADFGIAKILGRTTQGISLTRPSGTLSPSGGEGKDEGASVTRDQVIGTPQYMAPEQTSSPQKVDHRADIYSLGVVLYEMLTGELPASKLQPPSRKVQLDVRIDEIVLHALEKEPERRYQTVTQFKTMVETVAAGGGKSELRSPKLEGSQGMHTASAGSPSKQGKTWPWVLGCLVGTLLLGLLLVILLVGIFGLGLFSYQRVASAPAPRQPNTIASAVAVRPDDSRTQAASADHPVVQVTSGKPAEVQLGRGISVEVVGVLRNPRESDVWLRPDGSVFDTAPAEVVQLAKPRTLGSPVHRVEPNDEVFVYYRFHTPDGVSVESIRMGWQPKTLSLETAGEFPTVRDGGKLRQTVAHFALQEAVPSLNLTVRLVASDAVWEPVAEFDGKRTKELLMNAMVVFSPPRFDERAKRYVLDVMHNLSREDHALRLVAHLKGGGQTVIDFHPGVLSGTPTKGFALVYPDEVEIDNVEKWVLERTPWMRGEIRNIAVQPRSAPTSDATTNSPILGSVREVTLNDCDVQPDALDFETGRILVVPEEAQRQLRTNNAEWFVRNGVDLLTDTTRKGVGLLTTLSNELQLVTLADKAWDAMTGPQLSAALSNGVSGLAEEQVKYFGKVYFFRTNTPAPLTLGFKTGSGTEGILQLTRFGEGDEPPLTLRYKLVQDGSKEQPASNRTDLPSTGSITEPDASAEGGVFVTRLSSPGKIEIVRHPPAVDFSRMVGRGKIAALPSYDPESRDIWQVDLRSCDLSALDLSDRLNDLLQADFDTRTLWPASLPPTFDVSRIMELGRNPGLGVRSLHERGITGAGVGIAIIDQALLVDHVEYRDRLRLYEEIHWLKDSPSEMHGPAVASIAVGKTVGVAPEADLYYIAEWHSKTTADQGLRFDLTPLAQAVDRLVGINRRLPRERKIRVMSVSLGINPQMAGFDLVRQAITNAEQEGIYVVYVGSDSFAGLGRAPLSDPDRFDSFVPGQFWSHSWKANQERLLVPMDSRCVASFTGIEDYMFNRAGGASWTVPWVAGLYALACQVKPDITPSQFWEAARKTSVPARAVLDGVVVEFGRIINPSALLDALRDTQSRP